MKIPIKYCIPNDIYLKGKEKERGWNIKVETLEDALIALDLDVDTAVGPVSDLAEEQIEPIEAKEANGQRQENHNRQITRKDKWRHILERAYRAAQTDHSKRIEEIFAQLFCSVSFFSVSSDLPSAILPRTNISTTVAMETPTMTMILVVMLFIPPLSSCRTCCDGSTRETCSAKPSP